MYYGYTNSVIHTGIQVLNELIRLKDLQIVVYIYYLWYRCTISISYEPF